MYISFVSGACVLMPLRRNLRGMLKMEIVTPSIAGNPSFSWLVGGLLDLAPKDWWLVTSRFWSMSSRLPHKEP